MKLIAFTLIPNRLRVVVIGIGEDHAGIVLVGYDERGGCLSGWVRGVSPLAIVVQLDTQDFVKGDLTVSDGNTESDERMVAFDSPDFVAAFVGRDPTACKPVEAALR